MKAKAGPTESRHSTSVSGACIVRNGEATSDVGSLFQCHLANEVFGTSVRISPSVSTLTGSFTSIISMSIVYNQEAVFPNSRDG